MSARAKYLILIFIIASTAAWCQDPHFSQFYANQLYLSPSFAGATEDNRFSLNWRNQWPSIPGVFTTYSLSFDKYLPNFSSGVGLLATYDVAGSGKLSNTNIGLVYSYDFKANDDWHIRPGVNFKFAYVGLDINSLIWASQISTGGTLPSTEPPPFDNIADVDFTASTLAYTEKIWVGFTVDHLLRPRTSLWGNSTSVPLKIDIYGGFQIISRGRLRKKLTEVISVATNFMIQGDFIQSDIGLYYLKYPMVFGVWYRGIPFVTTQAGDAIIGMVGLKYDRFNVGISYDYTISNLITTTGGAYEISIVYEFPSSRVGFGRRLHAIPCPEF